MKSFICIVAIFFLAVNIKAQDKDSVVKYFDVVGYYPDTSKVKVAYRVENGLLNGYFIKFSIMGDPIIIGQYKNGKPSGIWLLSNGDAINYRDYDGLKLRPGCGTGVNQAIDRFKRVYSLLLKGERDPFIFNP